jgi:predicted nucleic acid-binding protein
MNPCVLDTDILTEVFKGRNATVAAHAGAYLKDHGQFAVSAMTRFEVLRGLRHKQATKLLVDFEVLCSRLLVLPITDDVLDRAADLWVDARQGGHPQRDADLIIAASALVHRRELATGNVAHFQWISGLTIIDWRNP